MDALSYQTANADSRTFRAKNADIPAKGMSITDAINLHDALGTVVDVLSGLASQPRFRGCGDQLFSVAGDEIDNMADAIGFRMGDLYRLIRASHPETRSSAIKRAAFLTIYAIEDDGDEAERLIEPFMASPS